MTHKITGLTRFQIREMHRMLQSLPGPTAGVSLTHTTMSYPSSRGMLQLLQRQRHLIDGSGDWDHVRAHRHLAINAIWRKVVLAAGYLPGDEVHIKE